MELIAYLGSGKGTWGQVNALFKLGEWEKVYVICNDFSYDKFEVPKSDTYVKLKLNEKKLEEEYKRLSDYFKEHIKDIEVALNVNSGTGMEYMALLSALLRAGLGIRFVYAEFDELKEFSIFDRPFISEEE